MNYLSSSEYGAYGLEATTAEAWVTAASALMDSHCRRKTLGTAQYTERLRVSHGRNTIRLTYLPLVPSDPSTSAVVSARARYAMPRRGESLPALGLGASVFADPEFTADVALAFGLPGQWTALDPSSLDCCSETGEVSFPLNALGLGFNEIEITYTAGFDPAPDSVKFACAQIVRNAQATPALNVRSGSIDRMTLEYFSDSLMDASVRAMLAPYVAQKVA
jgi:hypothetical protein